MNFGANEIVYGLVGVFAGAAMGGPFGGAVGASAGLAADELVSGTSLDLEA